MSTFSSIGTHEIRRDISRLEGKMTQLQEVQLQCLTALEELKGALAMKKKPAELKPAMTLEEIDELVKVSNLVSYLSPSLDFKEMTPHLFHF